MRVNSKVFSERTDMFQDLYVKNCPNQIEPEANKCLNLLAKPGYSVGKYRTITEAYKKLTVDYWREYDGLDSMTDFREWFVSKATEPSKIERALRLLIERNYVLVDEDIRERAQEAARNYRQAVRG